MTVGFASAIIFSRRRRREVGIVLPVGCGKSGLIAVTPYAVGARRALSLRRAGESGGNWRHIRTNSPTNFYERFAIFAGNEVFPETTIVESGRISIWMIFSTAI